MKTTGKSALSIIIIFLWGSFVSAQSSGEKSLLWEISGNGLKKSSWLFGTIHIMPKEDFEVYPTADEKLKSSDLLVLEVDIDVPLSTQMQWARMLMLPEGESLKDFFPSEGEFEIFKNFILDSLKVKEMFFNAYLKMKPFAVYSALIPEIIGKKIEGYDLYFNKIAKKKDIPVIGLESFEFQLAIFDSIPEKEQVRMFFEINELKKSSFDEMLSLYKSQDIYSMAKKLLEDTNTAQLEEQLLISRNTTWVPRLCELMEDESCFVAVGAAHLAGEHGLIGQLREKGYQVKALFPEK